MKHNQWKRNGTDLKLACFREEAEEVYGRKSGRRRYKEKFWRTDVTKEVVRRKNNAWREWLKKRTEKKKK
jgi:hypothetical protein